MKKDIIAIFSLILVVCIICLGTEIQSVDEYYLTHIDDIKPDSKVAVLSVRCDSVFDNYDKLDNALKNGNYIPKDGYFIKNEKYVIRDNDSAFDILYRAVRYKKIAFNFEGADESIYGSAYIKGIGNLYERSCGETSGWLFKVNGEFPKLSCSDYKLKNNDVIEFIYICDMNEMF